MSEWGDGGNDEWGDGDDEWGETADGWGTGEDDWQQSVGNDGSFDGDSSSLDQSTRQADVKIQNLYYEGDDSGDSDIALGLFREAVKLGVELSATLRTSDSQEPSSGPETIGALGSTTKQCVFKACVGAVSILLRKGRLKQDSALETLEQLLGFVAEDGVPPTDVQSGMNSVLQALEESCSDTDGKSEFSERVVTRILAALRHPMMSHLRFQLQLRICRNDLNNGLLSECARRIEELSEELDAADEKNALTPKSMDDSSLGSDSGEAGAGDQDWRRSARRSDWAEVYGLWGWLAMHSANMPEPVVRLDCIAFYNQTICLEDSMHSSLASAVLRSMWGHAYARSQKWSRAQHAFFTSFVQFGEVAESSSAHAHLLLSVLCYLAGREYEGMLNPLDAREARVHSTTREYSMLALAVETFAEQDSKFFDAVDAISSRCDNTQNIVNEEKKSEDVFVPAWTKCPFVCKGTLLPYLIRRARTAYQRRCVVKLVPCYARLPLQKLTAVLHGATQMEARAVVEECIEEGMLQYSSLVEDEDTIFIVTERSS